MVRLDQGTADYAVKKAKLETALRVIHSFGDKLKDAIKDEHDAQSMYDGMAGMADKLSNVDSMFRGMAGNIRTIRGQEANHERQFSQMVNDYKKVETRIREELERLKEEERKKQQVKEPHRPYGRR